jgi:two-component system KDP operon response regulator KdpE
MMDQLNKILIIDDDEDMLVFFSNHLENKGYDVITAQNGQQGLRTFHQERPNLVVLDIEMPQMNGWTTCERIRELSDVPIIMLTAAAQSNEDMIRGLDLGADDFLIKSPDLNLFAAHVRATLRRASIQPTLQDNVVYQDDYLTINLEERRIFVEGETTRLTPTEFNLLTQLVSAYPHVMSYRDLLERVWGWEYINDIDYLRVYVWHLRRKLEPNPKEPIYILNEMGVGYRFEKPYYSADDEK